MTKVIEHTVFRKLAEVKKELKPKKSFENRIKRM